MVLTTAHFSGEVPTADDAFHSTREEVPLALDNREDGSRVLPDSRDAVNFFTRFLNVPDLHGGVFGDRGQILLIAQKAQVSHPILVFFQVGDFLVVVGSTLDGYLHFATLVDSLRYSSLC